MKNETIESNVSYYNLHFPAKFSKAKNALLYSDQNQKYIDFFSAAGSMNYGHNNEYIKKQIIDYLQADSIIQGLDMDTVAKEEFLSYFKKYILTERNLDYKIQLCGPTGTNAVEAALRLARKLTGRTGIFALTGGFHGMTLGSLSISSIRKSNSDYLASNQPVTFVPYAVAGIDDYDPIRYLEFLLSYEYSGVTLPAAFIFESVQAEGGVNVLSDVFLWKLQDICNRYEILLICDDIQVGCFRTGTFFSFEPSKIFPDFIVLSKSISGYGIPMSILLIRPSLDIWESGEHSGTFRGNQLAFVGAKSALEFAASISLPNQVNRFSKLTEAFLSDFIECLDKKPCIRGKGMIWGLDLNPFGIHGLGLTCSKTCFEHGLIIEVCGVSQNVLKIMPPLTIEEDYLKEGLRIIRESLISVV